jgi:hypothetical protein
MKIFFLIVSAFVISLPELVVYTNDEYHFEVKLPREYKSESDTLVEKFGSTHSIKLSGRDGGAGYTVIATKYESSKAFQKSGANFQELIVNRSKFLCEEFFLKNNFVILTERHTKNVLEYLVGDSSTDMAMIRRVYIRNGISYSLSIYCNKEFLAEGNVEPFFKSLKIKAK